MPLEVITDDRLTDRQRRVLIALFAFHSQKTGPTVWPSRARLSGMCGIHPDKISEATTALVALGWMTKSGHGGRSRATRYTLTTPNLNAPQAGETLQRTKPPRRGEVLAFPEPQETPPDSGRGIEVTNEDPIVRGLGGDVKH